MCNLIVLPDGIPRAKHRRDSSILIAILKQQKIEKRLNVAICAAPTAVLYPYGLLKGDCFTCHPYFRDLCMETAPAEVPVVVDGNLTTNRGADTAVEFSLKLVKLLYDTEEGKRTCERHGVKKITLFCHGFGYTASLRTDRSCS